MTEDIRGTTPRALRWTQAAAVGCAGLMLWSVPTAVAAEAAPGEERSQPRLARPLMPFVEVLATEDQSRRAADREAALRSLAEEMTARLMATLTTQARAQAGEMAALERRVRAAEEKVQRADEARGTVEAGLRTELESIRALLSEAEDVSGDLRSANRGLGAALGEARGDADRLKAALVRSLGELAASLRRAGQLALERDAANAETARAKAEAEAVTAELGAAKAAREALVAENDASAQATAAAVAKLTKLNEDHERALGERDAVQARADAVAAELAALKTEAERLGGERDDLSGRLAAATAAAARLEAEGERLEAERDQQRARAEAATGAAAKLKTEREQLSLERDDLRGRLETASALAARFKAEGERLEAERDQQRARAEAANGAMAKLKTEREQLSLEKDDLRGRLEAASAVTARLKSDGERTASERDQQRIRAEATSAALTKLKTEHEQITAERDSLRGRAEAAAGALAMVKAQGDRLTGEREALRAQAEAAADALARLRAERERVEEERDALRAQAEAANAAIVEVKAAAARVTAERDALDGQAGSAAGELTRLKGEYDRVLTERDALRRKAAADAVEVSDLRIERDRLAAERDVLQASVEETERRPPVQAEADPQGLASQALERLGQIEQFISSTGIDVQRLAAPVVARGAIVPPPLPAARQTGARGGPFIPDLGASRTEPSRPNEAAIQIERQIDRMARVERILRVMPLGAPLQHYGMESGFGPRIDPFRRRAAMHEGVDLSAPMRTPIRVTAPGTVVHSGWKSAYGNAVDVEHASGLKTRYAHLAETKVRVGEQVQRGDVVGLLGSTGRSTGAHVHYEVIVEGAPVNPVRFIGPRK